MRKKILPFTKEKMQQIIKIYPTPFHVYDEAGIRKNARKFLKTFSWNSGFKEYFAVKALPNPHILQVLREEGFGVDCSSLPELLLAELVGFRGEEIMFTSNDTPVAEYRKAKELGAIINLDDISHIAFLEEHIGLPDLICFRYNPGPLRTGNAIIGKPEEAKYGLTKQQLIMAYKTAKRKGVQRFGLHTMVASNELNPQFFIDTAAMLFDLVVELSHRHGIRIEFVNLGGGIGIPYRPEQKAVDLSKISNGIHKLYREKIITNNLYPLCIYTENGRMITGPYGYLVSTVLHEKNTYKHYIGLDSCMANLMRPGMYGAYHHISVLGKEHRSKQYISDVTGSLCENNDKFAIDRKLPRISIGDIVIIHDTGAHGHAMGFNYNGKLRSAELLLQPDGSFRQIRRAEVVDDYFATLNFDAWRKRP
ncbi:MAG: diaminopimelate decarboxylase [Patescibacteria group bacterium]|nr:diaminopimelate decarboxylase [Patescibacteria group bacterium]MDE2590870.1 diaminopimelate decarboxylase [Patescibacteria group bacterium]